jgi:hypothetical protein
LRLDWRRRFLRLFSGSAREALATAFQAATLDEAAIRLSFVGFARDGAFGFEVERFVELAIGLRGQMGGFRLQKHEVAIRGPMDKGFTGAGGIIGPGFSRLHRAKGFQLRVDGDLVFAGRPDGIVGNRRTGVGCVAGLVV